LKIVCPNEPKERGGVKADTKGGVKGSKYFLVRDSPYPKQVPLPFSDSEKEEYGFLMMVLFILYFHPDGCDSDKLEAEVEQSSGIHCDQIPFGKWPDLLNKWRGEDYLKFINVADPDPTKQRRLWRLGPRFYAEIGVERIQRMAREVIYEEDMPEPEEEEEKKEATEEEPAPEVVEERPRRACRDRRSEVTEVDDDSD
jgi:hypothetical protein